MGRRSRYQHRSLWRQLATALIVAALAFSAGSASADLIQPIDQMRSVRANANADGAVDQDSTSAAAYEPFDACVMADVIVDSESASASACQLSQIGSESVSGSGDASSFADGISAFASADSDFDLSFTVQSVVSYAFVASVSPDPAGGPALVSLTDVTRDETIAMVESTGETFVSSEGRLDPGEYRIIAYASGIEFGGSSSFNFSLTVPEPSSALLQLAAITALAGLGFARRRPG